MLQIKNYLCQICKEFLQPDADVVVAIDDEGYGRITHRYCAKKKGFVILDSIKIENHSEHHHKPINADMLPLVDKINARTKAKATTEDYQEVR